ncbi:SDR family oxidoreductase [Candidimonas sp. SYP-B2681]|uniref:SDR family oxidoreductase n=1 Tax=Candidimonas sp. SYP-B2681 TaxID=2497686 RepID=UPI000F8958D4|nr:SDR family oxidoreductase [Candidimonas sp. SYP-B2681]RTZ48209.1 SDR family oxidoreductase [Candidimonas sp. SYP-B2681]
MGVKELLKLDNQVALITGGSRGLGLQIAEALGEMGCRLAITARKTDELEQARSYLEKQGVEVIAITNNLAQFDTIPAMVGQVLDHYGTIDILVNNAGATWGAPAEDYPDAAWHKVMDVNINALFYLCREVGRRTMIPQQRGKIINVASAAGLRGTAKGVTTIAYNTSKAAAVNFTRTLACEWGKYNINVNAICPGFFSSKLADGLIEQLGEGLINRIPLGRIGGPDDLKGTAVFLASEASRHITGQAIVIDGGASA